MLGKKNGSSGTTSLATTTTTASASTTMSLPSTAHGTVQLILPKPQKVSVPEPVLNRPMPDTSHLDQTMVIQTEADIQTSVTNLEKNNTSYSDWIHLGDDRKLLGDYVGASQAWEYAGLLYPLNLISFNNLGDLYSNFLHDSAKAETEYQIAIKNDPTNPGSYHSLYNLYIQDKNNTAAVSLLKQGIQAIPGSFEFQVMLARYYRDAGNMTLAKQYYDQAISIAQKQQNTVVVTDLQSEEMQLSSSHN